MDDAVEALAALRQCGPFTGSHVRGNPNTRSCSSPHSSSAASSASSVVREIFEVVDEIITDVWNPNAVAEKYPAGPWAEFEK